MANTEQQLALTRSVVKSCHINEEFRRCTAIPLESTFMSQLDRYTPKLLELFSAKGGVTGQCIKNLLMELIQDPSTSAVKKRDVTLRCLIEYMGESGQELISDYCPSTNPTIIPSVPAEMPSPGPSAASDAEPEETTESEKEPGPETQSKKLKMYSFRQDWLKQFPWLSRVFELYASNRHGLFVPNMSGQVSLVLNF
ncbi:hypothetical protein JOB18_029396 [Solea senegalensis]|uniref:Uncharacterized protein n=1 Tax=Solea senegalensis TaxID=28829 RepID=A0AAV6SLB1_SOLSE|nr:hypothetical protein JOB18_029396 [Solea senegalensis]